MIALWKKCFFFSKLANYFYPPPYITIINHVWVKILLFKNRFSSQKCNVAKKFGLFYSFVYFHQVFYELLKIIWYDERRIDA